jgi:hypothetical protein
MSKIGQSGSPRLPGLSLGVGVGVGVEIQQRLILTPKIRRYISPEEYKRRIELIFESDDSPGKQKETKQ